MTTTDLRSLRIPDGWTLEAEVHVGDHALLSTPPPLSYMTTIDFGARGFRAGCGFSGTLVGDVWGKPRQRYAGRGWKQELVADAVEHLRRLL